ncbi:hypothetical protein AAGS61_15235 [Lysinibacillus sp. KU-BSD001]|uniref:hypothetical protein n=1 Tax=Lysinibacillus sp. KU-BSD001 TaxID=3141328 RepID=UPI0036EA637A
MKHSYFKLNEEDILHIVKDFLLQQLNSEQSQGNLALVQASKDELHLVAAFSNIEDDSIQQLDLQSLGKTIDYNGPISSLTDSNFIDTSSTETKEKVQQLLQKLKDEGIE